MRNKIIFILIFVFTLLTSSTYSQIYVEGVGGVNSITLSTGYNFIGNVGFGYTNKHIKIGIETGISTGVPYKINTDPSTSGGVSFTEYVDGNNYSSARKKIVSYSGNIYSSYSIIKANQFLFGINTQWYIIHTFTENCKYFDISLFSGIGFGMYHDEYTKKYFQPYIKTGLEFDFFVKNITFFLQTDIIYFSALNGINYQSNSYHSYIQQHIGIGIRYIIELPKKSDNSNNTYVHVYNCCEENNINTDTITIQKTVPLPVTILFANNRYDIRNTEIEKLNTAIQYINKYNLHVKLIGMASNIGTHTYNKRLSIQRCNTIENYLLDNGVSEEQIEIQALGDSNSEFIEQELDRCVILMFE